MIAVEEHREDIAMTVDETRLSREHNTNIRRLKRLLRPLPRRSNIHRYPFLKWFTKAARQRAYFWSFRSSEVVPTLYVGCILAFMPLYGAQFPLALAAAVILRSNLPIIIGLQLISNPLTIPVIYTTAYLLGDFLLGIFGDAEEVAMLMDDPSQAQAFRQIGYSITATMVGGMLIGYFTGFAASLAYRIGARRAARTFRRVRNMRRPRPKNPDVPATAVQEVN